jgi:glutathione synthase/RimK-type ligase-like ATP-grasp enzyme
VTPSRVCFVTCVAWPDISESDGYIKRALERRSLEVRALAWNDPGASFDGFDAVVFRSSRDYHHAPDAYLEWLARWEQAAVRFWNPPDLIRWNLSKRYLLELERAGVGVIPPAILDDSGPTALPAVLAERGWRRAVVKPVLGASAHDATLVTADTAAEISRAIDEGRLRRPVMVQPFLDEIRTQGEWSLVFIDGALTHAVLKRPADYDFRVQPRFGGSSALAEPPDDIASVGRRVLEALPETPLYARVDGIPTAAGFRVMEVELHEP